MPGSLVSDAAARAAGDCEQGDGEELEVEADLLTGEEEDGGPSGPAAEGAGGGGGRFFKRRLLAVERVRGARKLASPPEVLPGRATPEPERGGAVSTRSSCEGDALEAAVDADAPGGAGGYLRSPWLTPNSL